MRIVIIAQEEPVYFGPFLSRVIDRIPEEVVLVAIAGSRGAGSHPRTLKEKLKNLYILWSIMEPGGFVRNAWIGIFQGFLNALGPRAQTFDRRSLKAAAARHNIPTRNVFDVNAEDFIKTLKEFQPDVIINQSELLLKSELLAVPKIGVVNRHASLLPHFRGRLGSWWSHAAEPPEYGVTVHFVDKDIDSGPIILQKRFRIDARLSYTKVLDILFRGADSLMLEALEQLRGTGFIPQKNDYQGTKTYLFPTLDEVRRYKKAMSKRRKEMPC